MLKKNNHLLSLQLVPVKDPKILALTDVKKHFSKNITAQQHMGQFQLMLALALLSTVRCEAPEARDAIRKA